ncbi:hypothetical protein LIER_14625 [Lithospermum erythrorhizon]|uniref:DUF4219 domain-containing protein n=1 Tax=Lithospermum erythrorhizon TaxID=34254 RepID=A0AAV3Q2D4_LITER
MENMRQGRCIYTPPLLDRTNYADWRTRMIVFLRSIDKGVWKVVLTRWTVPTMMATDGADQKMFKLINMSTTAKEAWEILETTHQGDQKVKDDQDPHLGCDDVEPNDISNIGKTKKVAADIYETLVEESVTLCVGNTEKTTIDVPSANDTCVLKNNPATREACTLETTNVSRNVVPTVVQHVADKVHKKNNPTEEIIHTTIMAEEDVTPSTGDIVVDTAKVPSFENLVESVVPSVEDTTKKVSR